MKTTQVLAPAQAVNGATAPAQVDTAKMTLFTVHSAAATTATVKFVASFMKDTPDFSAASTTENDWHYVEVIDVVTGTPIDGTTGVSVAAGVLTGAYQLNVDGAYHVGAILSGVTGGSVDISVLTETSPSC